MKTGRVFDWNRISRSANQEILAVTAEVGRGFSLGRSSWPPNLALEVIS